MSRHLKDLRVAVRGYLREPGFTLTAVATLALGIGAATAIFSVVKGVLVTPLPLEEPDRLVWAVGVWEQGDDEGTSPPDFYDYRERSGTFASLAAFSTFQPPYNLTGQGRPVPLQGRLASAGFFRTLGVRPVLGREFTRDEETPGSGKVVMLSHALWRSSFGADSSVVGTAVTLNGTPYTVVGVLPELPDFLGSPDVWTAMQLDVPTLRRVRFTRMIGRLGEATSLQSAQDEMSSIAGRLEEEHPATNETWDIRLVPLTEQVVGPVRTALMVLLGGVVALLLVACVNVANLLLARAADRDDEFAVRAALGASRSRLAGLVMKEALVLALAGGAAGVMLAWAGVEVLSSMAPPDLPRMDSVGMDPAVLAFALGLSVATGLLFGGKPAWRNWGSRMVEALKDGGRTATSEEGFRSFLVVGQVAATLVLLVAAGLLGRSLWRLYTVDPGFSSDGVLVTRMTAPASKYDTEVKRANFWTRLTRRVGEIPGVLSAGISTEIPLSGQRNPTAFTAFEPGGDSLVINIRSVTPEYLSTLGIPLLEGRHLSPRDRRDAPPVAVINRRMARDFFPEEDPVGESLVFDFGEGPYEAEIVGVVGNVRHSGLSEQPFREAYFPAGQTPLLTYNLLVRAEGDPTRLAPAVRQAVWSVDSDQPVREFRTMGDVVSASLAQPRFRAVLLGVFAVLALLLSVVGLYGLLTYRVTQRRREIGIRMAMGAGERDIVEMVLGHGLKLTAVGLAVGLAGSLVVTRFLQSLLYQVGPLDPLSFGGVSVLMVTAAVVGSWVPAARAARLDPMEALRWE